MSEMIERVARAILAAHDWTQNPVTGEDGISQVNPSETGWETLTPDWQDCLRHQARAAIEAMREPTEPMREAGYAVTVDDEVEVWQAMIDAALSSPNHKE